MNGPEHQALVDLLAGRPSEIELDRAALELARLEYPDLDAGEYVNRLDRFAINIAQRAGDLSDGAKFVAAANSYLFGEVGLRGNTEDYYNAENSYLNRVLDTGRGIPMTLSAVYIEVARRLSMPVLGVGLPGHFVVRYDDGNFASFIDPFNGGALLDAEGCRGLAGVDTLDPAALAPVDRRAIVERMVNNLRYAYFSAGEPEKALRFLDLLIEAAPENADEHKQRAVALLQMKRMGEAMAEFRRYLELAPGAPDREAVGEQIRNLAFWLASRN